MSCWVGGRDWGGVKPQKFSPQGIGGRLGGFFFKNSPVEGGVIKPEITVTYLIRPFIGVIKSSYLFIRPFIGKL